MTFGRPGSTRITGSLVALTEVTAAEEARFSALVKKAVT